MPLRRLLDTVGIGVGFLLMGSGVSFAAVNAISREHVPPQGVYRTSETVLPERCKRVVNGGLYAAGSVKQYLFCENPAGGYSLFEKVRNQDGGWEEYVYRFPEPTSK